MDLNQEIQNALETLQKGGLILYPTDTVWGIGCDATNAEAVKKIYALKQREESKSMIVLLNGERQFYQIFSDMPEVGWQLIEFSDKPLTLVLDKPRNVASNLIAPDNTLGMRITKDPFCSKLIERLKKPLVSTSANPSGAPTPMSFKEISPSIVNGVDYVVNLHREKISTQSSTIIKLTRDAQVKIIRK